MVKMRVFLVFLVLLLICALLNSRSAVQSESEALVVQVKGRTALNCTQPVAEQEAVIREADKAGFTLRRIELIGNVSTTDEMLYRRIASRMEVGNLFSRRNLISSLKSVSRVRAIYPVVI